MYQLFLLNEYSQQICLVPIYVGLLQSAYRWWQYLANTHEKVWIL